MSKRITHVGFRLTALLSISDDETDSGGIVEVPVGEYTPQPGTLAMVEQVQWPAKFAEIKAEHARREADMAKLEAAAKRPARAQRRKPVKGAAAKKVAAPAARRRTR